MRLEPGRVAGNYEVLDYLRSSKEEICYRVRNTISRRVEAMRILGPAVASDPEHKERFFREMSVHARLIHPNILTFYRAFELDRQLVLTTELVEGVTLADRLLCGPLPWDQAVAIGRQLLAALGHAHSVGIVHRDVTPARMIITPDGVLKLADFGLAKANTSPALTQVGSVIGDLRYISPEQIRGTADRRSDLYAAGVVLYEALTGKVPFHQKSDFELMAAQITELPAALSTVNRDVPAALDPVIMKALQKDPAARYQDASEFAAALEAASAAINDSSSDVSASTAAAASSAAPAGVAVALAAGPSIATVPARVATEGAGTAANTVPTTSGSQVLPAPGPGVAPSIAADPALSAGDGEIAPMFSTTNRDGWGGREAIIYGSAAAAIVVVILAGWLLAGHS